MNRQLAPYMEELSISINLGSSISNSRKVILVGECIAQYYPDKKIQYDDAIYYTYFTCMKDIGDESVIAEILHQLGLGIDIMDMAFRDRHFEQNIWYNTLKAHENRIFKIPTIIIGDRKFTGVIPYKEMLITAHHALNFISL